MSIPQISSSERLGCKYHGVKPFFLLSWTWIHSHSGLSYLIHCLAFSYLRSTMTSNGRGKIRKHDDLYVVQYSARFPSPGSKECEDDLYDLQIRVRHPMLRDNQGWYIMTFETSPPCEVQHRRGSNGLSCVRVLLPAAPPLRTPGWAVDRQETHVEFPGHGRLFKPMDARVCT